MKFFPNIQRTRKAAFFTLPEILIAMMIFTMLIGAIMMLQLFAVRIYQLAGTKLTATQDGRRTINYIREQVREAKSLYIGSYSGSNGGSGSFTAVDNANQVGSALLIFPTTDLTHGVIFYQDPALSNLCSVLITNATTDVNGNCSGTITSFAADALFVTNSVVFQAEDYQGNILTDNSNNRIIHVTLQFSQLEYPVAGIGKGAMYDYYELHTRVTRRSID